MYCYLEKGEEKHKQAAIEEAQSLESEIQSAIEKAHMAVKTQAQMSAGTASHKEPFTCPNLPIVL